MAYTLNGITLESKKTPSGIGYWEWGTGNNLIVYLHGVGERGDGSEAHLMKLLNQGPLGRNGWGVYTWKFPDLFNRNDLKILYPQLPTSKSIWDIQYIDQFLDDVHQGQSLMLMGWSLGGGGVLRYVAQANRKHKITMMVGLASAIGTTVKGENVNIPYRFSHAQNDNTVNINQTDSYVSAIPNFDVSKYDRLTSGDHWGPLNLCNPNTGIYDEFINYSIDVPVIEDIEGKIVKRGNNIIGIFNNEEIVIK